MHTQDNVALIKAAWGTFASRDADRIAALFTDDAEWIAPKGNSTAVALGASDHMIGPAAIAHAIAHEAPRLFPNLAVEFRKFYAQGPFVIVEMGMTATLPNGLSYANDYCFIFECRDGKIALMREYMDTQSGFKQVFAKGDPFAVAS